MRMRALERLGHSVQGLNTGQPWKRAPWAARQLQRRIQRGSVVAEINSSVLTAARKFRPALVWADKQEFLLVETIDGTAQARGDAGSLHTGSILFLGLETHAAHG